MERILCLNFTKTIEPSIAEVFLAISPRIQYRHPNLIFIDLVGFDKKYSDADVFVLARRLSTQVGDVDCRMAIAGTPYMAQLLSRWRPESVATRNQGTRLIEDLSLDCLLDLEGLYPWEKTAALSKMATTFRALGIYLIGEILSYPSNSFRDRWGSVGETLWKRLHEKEEQIISPLAGAEKLEAYIYFENSVGQLDLLMNMLSPQLEVLFLRLKGQCRFAQQMELIFYCEFSDQRHYLTIEPASPSNDQKLFEDLLWRKLEAIDFLNPIQEIEIELKDVPEKVTQLDFFEPRDRSEDKWKRLLSFAKLADCEMGFLKPEQSFYPEKSFSLSSEAVTVDLDKKKSPLRPSLLLEEPEVLSIGELKELKKVTRFPMERIESSWWDFSKDLIKNRDYYLAISPEGQKIWLFQDRVTGTHFLHGFFD